MGKIKKNDRSDERQSLLVLQDMKLARALAGNDKKVRDKALRNLQEWFQQRSTKMPFTEYDYLRIWKGLFYSMWMSDKPLIQEECAENIAKLIHFIPDKSALLFFRSGLKLLSMEWFGIDQWRLDKFLMFVRRLLRQAFVFLKKHEWNLKLVNAFTYALSHTILNDSAKCLGLTMHITEIYLEELAKVSLGKISSDLVVHFVKPFVGYLSTVGDARQIKHVVNSMFHYLMQQSDVGVEHEERFEAWMKEGFPGNSIDAMEKMDVDDSDDDGESDEDDDQCLDPRAGHVDVVLPRLKFDVTTLLQLFDDFKFKKQTTTNGKKALAQLHQQFHKLAKGSYPLGITKVPQIKPDRSTRLEESTKRLMEFEKQLKREKRQWNRVNINKAPDRKPKSKNCFDSNIFSKKLTAFVNKNAKKKSLKEEKIIEDPDWSYENSFRRNSGLWIVHRLNTTGSPVTSTPNGLAKIETPADEWKQPLQNGETEIFVPSNKFKEKMKAQGKDLNETINKIIKSPNLIKIPFGVPSKMPNRIEIPFGVPSKTPNRIEIPFGVPSETPNRIEIPFGVPSKTPNLIEIPFGVPSETPNRIKIPFGVPSKSPRSEKKVRIALKFNQSQEIHEHEAQLKSSPGIPYDANKKPEKPLLKPNYVKSPINPFYKKKL